VYNPNVVAVCGGSSVCFIDCEQSKVIAKYTDSDELSQFIALDWYYLFRLDDSTVRPISLVAVGGKKGL
jgi:hypothetical protein